MSGTEAPKPETMKDTTEVPATTPENLEKVVSSTEENVSASAEKKEQSSAMQEPEAVKDATAEAPKINVNETGMGNENTETNGLATETEKAANSPEKMAEVCTVSDREQIEQLSRIAELKEPTTIGAGDTCELVNLNGNIEKPEKGIDEKLLSTKEKSPIEDNLKAKDNELVLSKLKEELKKMAAARDESQKKLESTEKKLTELQSSYDALLKGDGDEVLLRCTVDQLKAKLMQVSLQLEDRNRVVSNQEKQISALNTQVASLKEVESLTRSLLQIRNLEVKQLQAEVDEMEIRITEERERYSTMINKMDAAVKLNADLKKEYETQLHLFRDLREKYEEKVSLLSEEKRALENNVQPVPN